MVNTNGSAIAMQSNPAFTPGSLASWQAYLAANPSVIPAGGGNSWDQNSIQADPLLASWRVGLGRSTAWTSDASARWSQLWARWGGYPAFWAAVVKDTLPLGGSEGTAVSAKIDGERLVIAAESEQPWAPGATATARVAGPDGSSTEVRLERTAGGRFAGEIDATAAGSYSVGVSVDGPGGRLASGVALASQSYSPEYRPGPAEPEELARLSELSGGRGPIEAAAAFDVGSLEKGHGRRTLTGWLLVLAALSVAVDALPRRFEGRCFVNVELDRNTAKFVSIR